jgi:predicted O-linked N-acetylglucosamine transferase (SPINDLY family)
MTPQEATQQGLRAHQAGRLTEAESFYAAALDIEPDFPLALHLMGMLAFARQDLPKAEDWFSRAIAVLPEASAGAALTGRGEVKLELEQWEDALADFDRALALGAQSAATWNNRGLALNALKRFDEALESYARALALAPDAAQAHNNRGDTLRELRRFDQALASFERALMLDPADWKSFNNQAVTLSQMGRIDDALQSYNQALALNPDIPAALQARSNLLWSEKAMLAPALADADRLVAVAPDFPFARGSRMRLACAAARWRDYESEKALIDEGVRMDRPAIEPFIYLSLSDRLDDLQRCARLYSRARFPAQPPLWKGEPRKPGRVRVGYVCGEFRTHATLYLMAGLFEAHDKEAFEIFAFDNGGGDGSPLRARFEKAPEHVVDIRRLSDREAASRMRAAGMDVLVDLNGYSGKQRMGIFAHRPARVQVSYLAYAGTTGAPYMDYVLADRVVIRPGEEKYYDEKVVFLPHSYQINDDRRVIGETPAREAAGLPAQGFVFCNFNHSNKFAPAWFARWMRIVKETPGSVLWLLRPATLAQENLRREAEQRGVDPDRLIFAEHLPFENHLARLKLADLFLDGLPYGAHTTASDALWAGLPVLTCPGNAFAGRVAASLLHAVGLEELVMESPVAFEALALKLAQEPSLLLAIREKLSRSRAQAPLFDTRGTTRQIEKAFLAMLEHQPARSFVVQADS